MRWGNAHDCRLITSIDHAAEALPVIALWLFSRSPGPALAILQDLETGVGGTLGTMEVTAVVLLCCPAAMVAQTRTPALEQADAQ